MINQKEVGVQVAARTPVCASSSLWNNHRLDSLSDPLSKPQIRCLPLCGKGDSYRYVGNVQGVDEVINYPDLPAIVEAKRVQLIREYGASL
ncbi:hypothetical protein [Rouxiella sp. WC2420]|uniref:Uncharacterized protein n=1 Tax=Rouxiella sp. WC2420 TaxID=3234145 RepID=A0AB39VKN9_9GAMM